MPHTPRLEPCLVNDLWQGVCWYRRAIDAEEGWRGRRVFLEFGAAMQIADVWVNGAHLCRHAGGYQKFVVDLSEVLEFGGRNVVAVRLDNRDTAECPPGKQTYGPNESALLGLDFYYFGGLYREACLTVTDPLHISDPLQVHVEAGGGVFARFEQISEHFAHMRVRTHVANESGAEARARLRSTLIGPEGEEVARVESGEFTLPPRGDLTVEQMAEIVSPRLWHPDHPYLYQLQSHLYRGNDLADAVATRVGIRHLSITREGGLEINGTPTRIFGSNRHQEYPYLGNALSAQANRREARKVKAAGLNFIRLSHYPQHPAFLDACDELGILVQAAIPGWQEFHNTEAFVVSAYRDVRQLIRRDRHHPSVILWEVNLNESIVPGWFTRECQRIAHAEYPGDQCFTVGDAYPFQACPVWDVLHWEDAGQRKPFLRREYGDWPFGENQSTSRTRRGDGERAMLQQAWNFLWTHNWNGTREGLIGDATWCLFDYNRGYAPDIATCGAMDAFRLPKFKYFWLQSQRDPSLVRADVESGPMVFIASYWTPRESPAKVVVYSNCEEVELLLNGRSLTRRRPDDGPTTRYNAANPSGDPTYGEPGTDALGGDPFDGGNCEHTARPPFTFRQVPWEAGELRAVGYLQGKAVAEHTVHTPGEPASLAIRFDVSGEDLTANGADAIFAYALVLDGSGTLVPDAEPEIVFEVGGPAELVGPSSVTAEAGIAAVLLRAGAQPGTIRLRASNATLGSVQECLISLPSGR